MLACLLAGGQAAATETPGNPVVELFNPKLRALAARHRQLSAELVAQPESAGANTTPRLGWHSKTLPAADAETWAQVDLGRVWPVDAVALVAASGEAQGQQRGPGYGFPVRFRIEAADNENFIKPVVIHESTGDVPNPGVLPFLSKAVGVQARFVRVTALKAWPRRDDWIVALGEILVLSGKRNVAAGQPVRVSSATSSRPEWSPENLTDGQSLLGPPVTAEASPSNGYLAVHERSPEVTKWVQVDLRQECPLDEVRLFPARPTDFADAPGSGFPPRFRVEAATDPAFASSRVIFDSGANDFITPGENPVTLRGDGRPARHVRVTATRLQDRGGTSTFALAELQVWSGDVNAASGARVTALDVFDNQQYPRWRPEYLVDGFTSRHRILDLPVWLSGLAHRGRILAELQQVEQERRLVLNSTLALLAKGGAAVSGGLLLLAAGLLWRARLAKRHEVEALRTRIAADLHDEIGSQLSSIALAAQLAARRVDDPGRAREEFVEIQRTARETSEAMHDIVWLLKPGSTTLDELVARLRETAAAQLREVECQFMTEGVTPRAVGIEFTRNVYLLGKEALTNIARHARAKAVRIEVRASSSRLRLILADDGSGFDPASAPSGNGLVNMRRRAVELSASLQITSTPGAGTTLTLDAPIA